MTTSSSLGLGVGPGPISKVLESGAVCQAASLVKVMVGLVWAYAREFQTYLGLLDN